MSYTTIRTKFVVGATVYFHDSDSDTVQRGVVAAIEARCAEPGYTQKWEVLYSVHHAHAHEPPKSHSLIRENDLTDDPRCVWPEIVMPAPQEVPA